MLYGHTRMTIPSRLTAKVTEYKKEKTRKTDNILAEQNGRIEVEEITLIDGEWENKERRRQWESVETLLLCSDL